MPHFKPSKTSVIVITISLIILSILLIRLEIITKYPYGAIILYKHYKLKKEFQKELDEKWEQRMEEIEQERKLMEEYLNEQMRLAKEKSKLLENDHYGGKTPEETLALFVEALKKKDYKLAAKYYVPWMWKWAEQDTKDWIENYPDGLKKFLDAYDNGTIKRDTSYTQGLALDVYPPGKPYPYSIKMIFNDKIGIWKIEEF